MFSGKDLRGDRRGLAVKTDAQPAAIGDARQILEQIQFFYRLAARAVVVREPALRFTAIVGARQHDEAFANLVAFRLHTAVNQPHHHSVGRGRRVFRLDYAQVVQVSGCGQARWAIRSGLPRLLETPEPGGCQQELGMNHQLFEVGAV